MSKLGKNYVKKELKINTENFGFSFSHHKNKSTNFFSMTQKGDTNPQLNTNNNISNQFNNNNINIINININSNNNINKKKNSNKNSNSNINNKEKSKNPIIHYIKQKVNLNSNFNKKNYKEQNLKTETSPTNNNDNKNNLKDENINYSTSRPETEVMNIKNTYKLNNNKKENVIKVETPKQMIISYFDVKNFLAKKNLKFEFQKKEKIPQTEKSQNIKEKFSDKNKDKQKIIQKNYSNMINFKNTKHQSEENLLKFSNKYIYYNKNISQSKSYLNKNKYNNINNNINNNNEIYLKTSGNIQKEDNKDIKNYYKKNEEINIDKNKNNDNDKLIRHEKNNSLNFNMIQSPSSINLSNKSQKFSNSYYFQKFIYKKNNNNNNDNKNNINISNGKFNTNNSNNEINNNLNLKNNYQTNHRNNNLNFNETKNSIKEYTIYHSALSPEIQKDNISLEDYFNNELKMINFKNPEELHYLYIKMFQKGKEISQNFENKE